LLNLESYTQLDAPRDLAKVFDTTEYARWKGFRLSEDSRYVCLTLPHVLMRVPYGKDTKPVDGFHYEEGVTGEDHSKYLWGNASYALGARITNAFARYGWCAAIRGVEGGGLVDSLPTHTFTTEHGDVALKCPTETIITDRREKELSDLGFAPLVHCKGTDYAAFFSVQTCQKPKLYDKEQANANARLSAQLPYMLAVSRFAHYLKAMMRDKIGSFTSRKECETFLNNWIDGGRHRFPRSQSSVPLARGAYRSNREQGQARRVQGRRVLAASLSIGGTLGISPPGGRAAEVRSIAGPFFRELADITLTAGCCRRMEDIQQWQATKSIFS
jgi:type VI secretion system ImpC/EvpB family protein